MPLEFPVSEAFANRLIRSHEWSRRQQHTFLEQGMEVLRHLVGKHYGERGHRQRLPQNFVRMMTSILSRHLSGRNPQAMVEARDPRLRSLAFSGQLWANERFNQSNLEKLLRAWAIDAITFNLGAIKICSDRTYDGDLLEPYVDIIDRERFCWDMAATRWTEVSWVAHRYSAVKEDLMGPGFDEDAVRRLMPEVNPQRNERGSETTASLSTDGTWIEERIYDYIECWEFYLPRENLQLTFPQIGQTIDRRPIRAKEYVGLHGHGNPLGPFQILAFDEVPGNLMPSPPIHIIFDMHEALNEIVRKLLRQGRNQKTNTLVQEADRADGETLKRAQDGQILSVAHPDAFNILRTNGPDQANVGFATYLRNAINSFGGNLEVIGGLGVAAPTLGQEQMLDTNASKQLQFMQLEFNSATSRLMRAMLWYDWNSKREMAFQMPIPGMDMTIPQSISPEQRAGTFDYLNIEVHPFSQRPMNPDARLMQLQQLFGEIMQAAPLLVQQGAIPDIMEYFRIKADLLNFHDLDRILRVVPLEGQEEGQGNEPQSPNVRPPGTGEYTRTNVPSQEAEDQAIIAAMDQGDAAA